jgi:hypothetical protein
MDSCLRRIFLEALDVDLRCADSPAPQLTGGGRERFRQIRERWVPVPGRVYFDSIVFHGPVGEHVGPYPKMNPR